MRRAARSLGIALAATSAGALLGQAPAYPSPPRDDVVDELHGTRVEDPYRRLENADDLRTRAWVSAENRLTEKIIGHGALRESIRRRLTSLGTDRRTDVPWREGGRLFFLESRGDDPQPVLYVASPKDPSPSVALDPRRISPDGSVAIRSHAVSPDGRLLAYRTSPGGADVGDVRVKDLATGRTLADVVPRVLTSVCWTHDARGFFYVRSPAPPAGQEAEAPRPSKQVLYHVLGRPGNEDYLVREWGEDARWVYCMLGQDGRDALLVAEKGTESVIDAMDLGDPLHPDFARRPVRILGDRAAFDTPVDVVGGTLYVRTTDGAPRRRIVSVDLRRPASTPRTIVAEGPDVIEDAVAAGGRLVLHTLANVSSRLRLYELDGTPAGEIPLPGIGAVGWPLAGRPSSPELFYSFESFLAPRTVHRCDVKSGATAPFRPPRIPFARERYETTQVFFPSKDGARVPMFVTAAKGLRRDGTHPTLLTGYGGYGASLLPSYDPAIPLWLERGGVWAVANLRGGGEFGEEWHRAGMLGRKQTTFDDFLAAADFLIAQGYTSPGRLAIYGYSNGGLLVGAAVTQRPDLFAAAVGNAGHYDMVRFHRFTGGAGWISEYGSPDDPEAFPVLFAYSPLHRVRAGACYPATLLLAADHDDRVVPGHTYKFAAALQAAQACDRPILLRVATAASHSYASRREQIAEKADLWTFVAARLGAESPSGAAP